MNCPHCNADNPDLAKFCLNCGKPLEAHCANCHAKLAALARFCSQCGQPVNTTTPTDAARLLRLAATTPAPLAEKIRTVRLAGERKQVTVVFADVVGSTALAEHLDAEEWTGIMNRAFECISPAIYRYEGTIARLLGDAVLAFFGAPIAHEDDPIRAVNAALEVQAAARAYAAEVQQRYGIDFAMRVGINTGTVVVGDVGSDLKYEYTAMGDAVNLAARLQSAASPMSVLISSNTHRYVAPMFEVIDLGLIEVKGKSELIRVYEVVGAREHAGSLRGIVGLHSPMVGREHELNALLDATTEACHGLGQVVVVSGDAGLGKSRLIADWKRRTVTEFDNVIWVDGQCLSFRQGLAYHLITDILRNWLGVSNTAPEPDVRTALQLRINEVLGSAASEAYPYVAHLLSLQLDEATRTIVNVLEPQALHAQYIETLKQLLTQLSLTKTVVVILDDIHWIDPSSAELFARLLPGIANQSVLMCFVTRPDADTPGWRLVTSARDSLGAQFSEVILRPLTASDSRELVNNLLEIDALPDQIRALILRKSEGNPLFVEEVIRMLIDRGAITRSGNSWSVSKSLDTVDIPDNLQGLLLARIDRLPDDVKRTLRVAAVIGRQFSINVLEQVLAESENP